MEIVPTSASASTPRRLAADPPLAGQSASDTAKLRKAAQDFEALILRDVLQKMRQSSSGGKGLLSGAGQNLYQDLMDDELAKAMARQGGLGLADVLVRGLLRSSTGAKNSSSSKASQPMNSPSTTPTGEENH